MHRLFDRTPDFGAPLIAATYSRAFLDLNRRPTELDPDMFTEPFAGLFPGTGEYER